MLYIVDGTGAWSDDEYKRDMSGGFCIQLSKLYGGYYLRGPSVDGVGTFDKADEVFSRISADPDRDREPIYLAGHSRGGAAVIRAAQLLREKNIRIKAMFLFDAVDRTMSSKNVQLIPTNVESCYHAMRDRSLAAYYDAGLKAAQEEMDSCMVKSFGDRQRCKAQIERYYHLFRESARLKHAMRTSFIRAPGFSVPSIDFGNCGVGPEPPCKAGESACRFSSEAFLGTHGAMGGAPILDDGEPDKDRRYLIASDRAAVASVRAWMWANLKREGLEVQPVVNPLDRFTRRTFG